MHIHMYISSMLKGIAKISNDIGSTCKLNNVIHIIKNPANQLIINAFIKENLITSSPMMYAKQNDHKVHNIPFIGVV